MGNHKDIEDKFKKDISKEVANLKEFLIQQGKEIVKIKQENKALKDKVQNRSVDREDGSGGMTAEVRAILEKHQLALEKQKENTTKLSKLCLGTLNELEKFEKHTEREASAAPRTESKVEDRLKRLMDENKKLIQLVTTLDRQVNNFEEKFTKENENITQRIKEKGNSNTDITKDNVIKILKENLEETKHDNLERNVQVQSLVTEVQNIIVQVREMRVQTMELSEKVERQIHGGAESTREVGVLATKTEQVDQNIGKIKESLSNVIRRVDQVEKENKESQENLQKIFEKKTITEFDNIKKRLESQEKVKLTNEAKNQGDVAKNIEKLNKGLEATNDSLNNVLRGFDKSEKENQIKLENLENTFQNNRREINTELEKNMKILESTEKASADSVTKKLIEHEKVITSLTEEMRNKIGKKQENSTTDLKLLSDKVATINVMIKDDKLKNEENFLKSERHQNEITRSCDILREKLENLKGTQDDTQKERLVAEKAIKKLESGIKELKVDQDKINTTCIKTDKLITECNEKILRCSQDCDNLSDDISKLNKKIEKRPAAEELDKKSELTNKLYNDLLSQINDLENNNKKEMKKTKLDIDKLFKDTRCITTNQNEIQFILKQMQDIKDENVKSVSSVTEDIEKLKQNEKNVSKDLKNIDSKMDRISKESDSTKYEITSKLQHMETDIELLKKSGSVSNNLQNDISSLQNNQEKLGKDIKNASSEIKFLDSSLKKETTNTKAELSNVNKTLKGVDKDITATQKMVEVLKSDTKPIGNDVEIEKLKTDMGKVKSDQVSFEKKLLTTKESLQSDIKSITKDAEATNSKMKEEFNSNILSIRSNVENLEKHAQANIPDVDKKIEIARSEMIKVIDAKISSSAKDSKQSEAIKQCQDDLNNKISNLDKKVDKSKEELLSKLNQSSSVEKKIKDELNPKISSCTSEIKSVEKKANDIITKALKQEEAMQKLQKICDNVDPAKKTGDLEELKKEIGKVNQEMKESFKSCIKQEESREMKKEMEKINKQIKDNLKSSQDKVSTLETQVKDTKSSQKDISDKLAKLEKGEGSAKAKPTTNTESSKLVTLSKAIDSIQENTKSLELMVNKMKSEFSTAKDLDKLRTELTGKVVGAIDPNHPDMGPIMESLIMTNDRPYVDCCTVTPMTGNGLVKFDRFNAMNKLPWDDVGDQFVIQEPGVYAVFVTAIVQDAGLSIKIASSMLEREVVSVGSRDGLVGSACPAFVSRSALFQIDDDENCVETILVEIHADNEDSFIDKNVTLTMYKIAEGSGVSDE